MLRKKAEIFSVVTWVVILGCLASSAFAARKEKVLYSFCSEQSCNGFQGPSNLILDAAGNFYGTTIYGGTTNNGAVFQLTHGADGTWSQNVLYSFCSLPKCSDGSSPSSGLIFDAAGNLYGATDGVGTSLSAVVYQLAPSANGTWTERVLHTFTYGEGLPWGNLIFDAARNLYAATLRGGNPGTIFELMPQQGDTWVKKLLHTFQVGDGSVPFGPLVFDASGNLYGATAEGGTGNGGTVYELIPQANGSWRERVLHDFGIGSDGTFPSSVILDDARNVYGTARYGGVSNGGTIFRLSPDASGRWKEKVLHSFQRFDQPGAMIFDGAGNLYGPIGGGPGCPEYGCGGVFQFDPTTGAYRVISAFGHSRKGDDPDGVVLDMNGNLYGTTTRGGSEGDGVVFEVVR